jgi:ABC-type multidrug transport system fused ATPase/permease subunit
MTSRFDRRVLAPWIAAVGATGVFALDLLTPPQVVVASLYVLPMIALVWWGKRRGMYLGAMVCAGLILLGYALVPAQQMLPYGLINRLLIIVVLFVFAVAMGRRIHSHRELRRQYGRMKLTFEERNSALEALLAQQRQSQLEKTQLLERLAQVEDTSAKNELETHKGSAN